MSRLGYNIRPALFDVFSSQEDKSLKNEVARILMSRNLSEDLRGINSSFGIPSALAVSSENKEKVEYTIAYHIMKFENRLEQTTVKIESVLNGTLKLHIELHPKLNLEPITMKMELTL
ncbi:MAG: hypothetical protein H6850_04025 [Alphaproteobacteria bacterium]|nr:MAG: hypothetical protein H6850_04025 [Alphaproteobacteria bacterium]